MDSDFIVTAFAAIDKTMISLWPRDYVLVRALSMLPLGRYQSGPLSAAFAHGLVILIGTMPVLVYGMRTV